jgi:hypothetical protein
MGKRSSFERVERDYYPTPKAAVAPLMPHLPESFTYAEPCAGDGRLCRHLDELSASKAILTIACDIEPQDDFIVKQNALDLLVPNNTEFIITNPPWGRLKKHDYILHKLIVHFSNQRPTWLLFDADWAHTDQSAEFVDTRLVKIVSVGRVKWIEDSAGTGKDNCAWYLFDVNKSSPTEFVGRSIKGKK